MSISYGILGTYPPTQCGLATFSKALLDSLRSPEDLVEVVSVVDEIDSAPHRDVSHQWVRRDGHHGAEAAARALNGYDVAIIQHEYGIFGGRDGADILLVAGLLWVPTIVVLHTVLVEPTRHQRAILEELARLSVSVVTMTETARQRLRDHYAVDPNKIRVIPHGAADNRGTDRSAQAGAPEPGPTILSWGLLGEGKGIEWGIEAIARLSDLSPAPKYRIVGQTHPRVLERHGERYRDRLVARAEQLSIGESIQFDNRYVDSPELRDIVRDADVVLLPYDSTEQVTSGVLIEAITAGKPVVSTGFPHAIELLSSGAGIVVERRDPESIALALRRILTEPGLAATMTARANEIAPGLLWPAVARAYRRTAAEALETQAALASA